MITPNEIGGLMKACNQPTLRTEILLDVTTVYQSIKLLEADQRNSERCAA